MTSERDGASATTPGDVPARWSAQLKSDLVMRVLRGESLGAVSRDSHVPAHDLQEWHRVFLDGGAQSLEARVEPEERGTKRGGPRAGMADPPSDPHVNGEYFEKHPTWHVEFSPWKAANISRFMSRNNLHPKTICEVGCGAGEVLRQLQLGMAPDTRFWGYDVSPQAIDMAKGRENDRLRFEVANFGEIETPHFDLLLILEVVDHVDDYLGFLRMLKPRADWTIFSLSLDVSVQAALRKGALLKQREVHSHLHQFNKETALRTLEYAGFDVVDYCYPLPSVASSAFRKLVKPIKMMGFKLNPDLTARLLGGSLLVLAR